MNEEERTQTKNHTWTFATQPTVVEQISVPVIIEASAPVVTQVPDLVPPLFCHGRLYNLYQVS